MSRRLSNKHNRAYHHSDGHIATKRFLFVCFLLFLGRNVEKKRRKKSKSSVVEALYLDLEDLKQSKSEIKKEEKKNKTTKKRRIRVLLPS